MEVVGLTKSFGAVTACNSISMAVEAGRVHAVVGENGAGKTTLMRCVAGLTQPDSGSIRFDGEPRRVSSVEAARSLGVGMVHQEFSVVDDLTLAENLVLGIEPVRRGTLDFAAIESATSGLEARTGWKLPWNRPARDVGVADLSRFELLRQLHRGSDLLILDEPTAVRFGKKVLSPEPFAVKCTRAIAHRLLSVAKRSRPDVVPEIRAAIEQDRATEAT